MLTPGSACAHADTQDSESRGGRQDRPWLHL